MPGMGAMSEGPKAGKSRSPLTIEFRDVRFSVPANKNSRKAQTYILKGLAGTCFGARLTAIMGASGAGKTTLLNALACKTAGKGTLSGQVLVNGRPFSGRDFRRWGVYVMQTEPLLATATVWETIMTSALLQLPLAMSRREKVQRVNDIIAQLGLQHCQATLVGDEGTGAGARGISGGERKRLTVGAGLVTQPAVLLLDEPTSGLDSETAVAIVEILQGLARQGRTVVTTIHQPNGAITRCFDDLLLLTKGQLVYSGPWTNAVDYFDALGFKCPMYTNPSDYFMGLMKDEGSSSTLIDAWRKADSGTAASKDVAAAPKPAPFFGSGRVAHSEAISDESASDEGSAETSEEGAPEKACEPGSDIEMGPVGGSLPDGHPPGTVQKGATADGGRRAGSGTRKGRAGPGGWWAALTGRRKQVDTPPPGWYQVRVLCVRNMRFYARNPELLLAKLFTYIFMGGFMGLMYLRLPLDTATAGYNRSAALWVSMFAFTLMPSETACSVWNQERAVVTKEVKAGNYRLSSFFLARTAVSVPFESAIAIIFTVIIYNMIGFQAVASKYFVFMVVLVLVNLISEMVGFIGGIVTKDITVGLILISVVTYFCFAFSGFIVQPIPGYFVWLHKMSYYSLAYTALVHNEFTGLQLRSPVPEQCAAEVSFIPPPPANSCSIAQNIGFLALIAVGIRVLAFGFLWASFATFKLPARLARPLQRVKDWLSFVFC